ncbi:ABC transporter permease [Pseudidiomarina sp. 1APP75-32.1]|uniref:ABC transporter permease n=1 Tax=Pseudidiomarina terrestris TaxID=2820060 RepID=A0AAW7R2W3_9GAMM|nr:MULTISPECIES: ABC transporter permease [unclassified Pseudidiomarina]MDN7125550.1 ABC transporter permease [Pseudidiomarina sp. 1APP75-32.1]MDN7130587.1 ABC transporter permease [Pseudidiomarina sp. 1APR75-15]
MKHWRQVIRIGGFEFRRFFKWKQELFSLVLIGALFGVTAGWGVLKTALEETHTVAVVAPVTLPELANIKWQPVSDTTTALTELGGNYSGVLRVSASPEEGYGAELWAANSSGWQDRMQAQLQAWLQQQKLEALPLDASQIALLNDPVRVSITVQRGEEETSRSASKVIPMLILVSIMVGVFGSFGLMMTAITQEKQQRVTEQLLTIIRPPEWIDGKILGITLHCLKSMATVLLIIVLVSLLMMVIEGRPLDFPSINWTVLGSTTVFAIVGLVMINALMAGFAATIDDPNHSGRTAMMLIPALFVGAGFGVMDNLQGILAQILSWFPLTSFAVMPLRIADGSVSWWEVLGSLLLLLLMTYTIRSAAIRLFSMGITMYGKEPSWRMMGRAFIGRR